MDSLSWNKAAVLISIIAISVESAGERFHKVICDFLILEKKDKIHVPFKLKSHLS